MANFNDASGGGSEVFNWTADHNAQGNVFFLDSSEDYSLESDANVIKYINRDTSGGAHQFFVDDLVTPKFKITETTVEQTATSTNAAFSLYNDDSSPNDFDTLGSVIFKGNNSAASETIYGKIDVFSNDVSSVSEDGQMTFAVTGAGFSNAAELILTHSTLELHRSQSNSIGNGCEMVFHNDDASMNDGQTVGQITMDSNDSAGNQTTYGQMIVTAEDVTNGTEDGGIEFKVRNGGSSTSYIKMNVNSSSTIEFEKNLDMNDNNIIDVNQLSFNSAISGQFFSSAVSGIQYHVPSGDSHDLYVAGTRIVQILDQGLNMFGGELDFNAGGRVDFSDTQTTIGSNGSASALTANPVGYVNIKVNGV